MTEAIPRTFENYGEDEGQFCQVLKFCRVCEHMKDLERHFRQNNNVCRRCRNDLVKQWSKTNPLRVHVIRKRQTLNDRAKRIKTSHPVENVVNATGGNDEQMESV